MAIMVQAVSRRDRLRAATTQEIIQTARGLLVTEGPEAASLRAIAREMGMTAPALYRYFGSHEELLRHVVGDIFTDLASYVQDAIHAAADAAPAGLGQDEVMAIKLIAGCRAFRAWTLEHVPEFSMIFGSPLPGLEVLHEVTLDPTIDCGYKFGQLFLDLFGELYRRRPFAIPAAASWSALTSRLAPCRRSCAAGCCCTGRSASRSSGISGSPSTTHRPCSS
jgi:AcrR family transcriptional regulator